ncbi:carboxylic acid transporter [Aspergillus luchuensis]|uniref:Carboxylic acid transporter n=1 Tax=Aspergillus kawachii TaxID=1069201 RepID=A0A146F7Q6_ASPKA|nr:carboxylic acid transporter [Aspergillus luchuensis]
MAAESALRRKRPGVTGSPSPHQLNDLAQDDGSHPCLGNVRQTEPAINSGGSTVDPSPVVRTALGSPIYCKALTDMIGTDGDQTRICRWKLDWKHA